MRLDWLADQLRDHGLTVIEHTGWSTRTMRSFDSFTPVGIIDHHTAGSLILTNYPNPPYWPPDRLEDRCNLTIRGDAACVVVNAGYAFDSGLGSPRVLDAVRNDRPLPPLGGLTSSVSGNPWFIDIEVQHKGDGSPIHPAQREALIGANAAICQRFGWNPLTRIIGHREWAPDRKIDPRWDGSANPMPQIRLDTKEQLVAWTQPGDPIQTIADADAVFAYQGSLAPGAGQASYEPTDLAEANDRIWVVMARFADLAMQEHQRHLDQQAQIDALGGVTEAEVKDLIGRSKLTPP